MIQPRWVLTQTGDYRHILDPVTVDYTLCGRSSNDERTAVANYEKNMARFTGCARCRNFAEFRGMKIPMVEVKPREKTAAAEGGKLVVEEGINAMTSAQFAELLMELERAEDRVGELRGIVAREARRLAESMERERDGD